MQKRTTSAQLVNRSSVNVFRNAEYLEVPISAGACVEYQPLYDRLTQTYILRVCVNGKWLGWHWAERFGIVGFACRVDAARNAAFLTEQVMRALALAGACDVREVA